MLDYFAKGSAGEPGEAGLSTFVFAMLSRMPRTTTYDFKVFPRSVWSVFELIDQLRSMPQNPSQIYCLESYALSKKELSAFGAGVARAQAEILEKTVQSNGTSEVEYVVNVFDAEQARGVVGDANYAVASGVKGAKKPVWAPPRELRIYFSAAYSGG